MLKFVTVVLCVLSASAATKFESYCNSKYGFCVDYPSEFTAQAESDSGDGRVFESDDRLKTEIRVYGGYNLDEVKPKALLEGLVGELKKAGGQVTYRAAKADFVVVSGLKNHGATIYYSKIALRDDRMATLIMTYPRAKQKELDPIVAKVAASLIVSSLPGQ